MAKRVPTRKTTFLKGEISSESKRVLDDRMKFRKDAQSRKN